MSWLEDVLSQLQGGGAPAAYVPPSSPFPDVRTYSPPAGQDTAAALAAAGEAGGVPFGMAQPANGFRRMPDVNSAGVQLAMNNAPAGTGVPGTIGEPGVTDAERQMMAMVGKQPQGIPAGAPDGTPFGSPAPFGPGATIPPSLQLASTIAAPAPPAAPEPPVPGSLPAPGAVPMPKPRPDAAPDDGEGGPTDVSAQSRAPAAVPAAAVPAMPAPADPGTLARVSDALRGIGGALSGDNGAATTGILKDREAKAQQAVQGNATARLLMAKGASLPEVQAAIAGGPEVVKALLGQYLGKEKYSVVQTGEVEDPYGGKRKVFKVLNSNDGTFKEIPADSASEAKATAAAADGGGVPDLNEAQKNRVQAIIDGREPYPAQSRAPDAAKIRAAVHATDPNFDAVNYKSREQTRLKFTKGKGADNLTYFNTAISHLGSLDKAISELNNSGFPAWNKYVANPIAEQFDQKYQEGLKHFQTARTAVADELTKAFRGSGGNVHDIIQWENAINAADSPAALKAAVRAAAELLRGRIDAVGDEYNRGMGTTKDPLELLNPKAAEAFKRLQEGDRAARPASAPVKPGNYVWKNGALVPE